MSTLSHSGLGNIVGPRCCIMGVSEREAWFSAIGHLGCNMQAVCMLAGKVL